MHNAAIYVQNKNGRTALHDAAEAGSETTVHILIRYGAGISIQDKDGRTALYDAASAGSEATIHDLWERGKLYWRDLENHETVVWLLLGEWADVNTQCGFYGNALQGRC